MSVLQLMASSCPPCTDDTEATDYFRTMYPSYSKFSVTPVKVAFDGDDACLGESLTATLPRVGDLVGSTYIEIKLPEVLGRELRWVKHLGHALLIDVTLSIGGADVSSMTGEWMHIWNDLNGRAHEALIQGPDPDAQGVPSDILYVPLDFDFCCHAHAAIPLIALQYHEVKLTVRTRPLHELLTGAIDEIRGSGSLALMVDYVCIDGDERTAVATDPRRTYMVTRVQRSVFEETDGRALRLQLSGCVKELVFVCQRNDADFADFGTASGGNPVRSSEVIFNERTICSLSGKYTNLVQPRQYHSQAPAAGVNVVSFCLSPESGKPSGGCNLSGMDIELSLDLDPSVRGWRVTVFAPAWAPMVVGSGMAFPAPPQGSESATHISRLNV